MRRLRVTKAGVPPPGSPTHALRTIACDDQSHAGSRIIVRCAESCVELRDSFSIDVVVEAVTRFTVYQRSDCDEQEPERFTVVAPNGCALPLKPLTESQAKTLSNILNTFVDDTEIV